MNEDFAKSMLTRWQALAASLGLDEAVATRVGDHLGKQYCGPGRHYHDARHIVSMLAGFERFRYGFDAPVAAELAIFFHDVVYDPSRTDNEERSAESLEEMLGGSIHGDVLASATRDILATKRHVATPDGDANLIVDLDMAILASPWEEYERYATGVMREYVPIYGEAAYRQGRVGRFLEPAIARGTVFLTADFVGLDRPAMRNMRREADILKSGRYFAGWQKP